MNVTSWTLSLSFLILVFIESIKFHRKTVCRQEAYLKSTELLTKGLLSRHGNARDWHHGCRILFQQNSQEVHWNTHLFSLNLQGKL